MPIFSKNMAYKNKVDGFPFGDAANDLTPVNQYLSDKRPIPTGRYTIGPPKNSARTGPNLPLTPLPGTILKGRHTFQIHGDKRGAATQSSSNGCIIFNRTPRRKIWDLATKNSDFELIVHR